MKLCSQLFARGQRQRYIKRRLHLLRHTSYPEEFQNDVCKKAGRFSKSKLVWFREKGKAPKHRFKTDNGWKKELADELEG